MDFKLELLGWNAFQDLALTICRLELQLSTLSFSAGPDGGRDGAALMLLHQRVDTLGRIAVQCKHTSVSSNLSAASFANEIPKVEKLKAEGLCDTYFLFTNQRLTAKSQAAITASLDALGIPSVIHGLETIQRLLTESKQLRGMVPRIYGLGDLSEIIDERLYEQTRAMLDEEDLKRFVPTDPYRRTVEVLGDHGFVLLLGEPASGKSSIMRAAAIHAADIWEVEPLWLAGLNNFQSHWNPNRHDQLFLIDDVFGSTTFDPGTADMWNRLVGSLRASIRGGAKFILTSRDYVFGAAKSQLKRDELPVSRQGEVVIQVEKLSVNERRAIVYNHLRLGNQTTEFKGAIKQHLLQVTKSPVFLPETARRLGDIQFTQGLDPNSLADVARFLSEPREYLQSVIGSMSDPLRNALIVLVVCGGDVSSTEGSVSPELLERLGMRHRNLADAMLHLDTSFVRTIDRDGDIRWIARHPTVIDAMCDWMSRHPDVLDLYAAAAPLRVLTAQVTCGRKVAGAIQMPERLWPIIMRRVLDPSCPRDAALRFVLFRCSPACMRLNEAYSRDSIAQAFAAPGLRAPLDSDPSARLLIRMWGYGLLSDADAQRFVQELFTTSVAELDPYPLRNPSVEELVFSLEDGVDLFEDYLTRLTTRVNTTLLSDVADMIAAFRHDVDRVDVFAGLLDLLNALQEQYELPIDSDLLGQVHSEINLWVGDPEPDLRISTSEERLLRAIFGDPGDDDPFSDVDAT